MTTLQFGMRYLLALAVLVLAACGDSPEEVAAKAKAEADAEAACRADLDCLGGRLVSSPEVGLLCGNEIERLATHDVTWTATLLQQRFTRARWTSGSKDSITLIGDGAKFQNAFGANVPVVYHCDLTLDGATVIAVRAVPGRLEMP